MNLNTISQHVMHDSRDFSEISARSVDQFKSLDLRAIEQFGKYILRDGASAICQAA